jgi:hypothetical protein
MQDFDLPTHILRVLSDLRGHSLLWAVGNQPVNTWTALRLVQCQCVAVRGD